jgi:ABC-2 type transport system ATP-binding protein
MALSGISITVDQGEFFGLFGPNGAGKTTLIRILTGELEVHAGSGTTAGIPWGDSIAIKHRVGIVPESETPPTFLTAQETLELVCEIRRIKDSVNKIDWWLEFFGMNEQRDILCRDLSKGQRQKLMLMAAFIHEPELLLLDEPFINLDPIYQRRVRDYLSRFVDSGGTVFMCTHILEIAEKLCTRVAILDRGRVLCEGTLNQLKAWEGEALEEIFMRLVEV